MTVKGQNVLYWPYESIEEFKARPGMSGIPFLGPWIDRLDEQAFFANGRRRAFDMQLGNVRGEMPSHGFVTTTDRWTVVEAQADTDGAWVTSRLEFYRQPMWMKQWPFAAHHRDDASPARRRARSGDGHRQHERRADADRDRLPPVLPADRLASRRVDAVGRRADALAAHVE
jgi:hypothetical protein